MGLLVLPIQAYSVGVASDRYPYSRWRETWSLLLTTTELLQYSEAVLQCDVGKLDNATASFRRQPS